MPSLRRSKRLARAAHMTKEETSTTTLLADLTNKKRKVGFSTPTKKRARTNLHGQEEEKLGNPDLYAFQKQNEVKYKPNALYMSTVQQDISFSMRSVLIDWLIEVGFEYKLQPDTMFLTVNYIDRFLSAVPIHRSQLQLVGVTCMFVASKYEEIDPPRLNEYVYICDNTYTKKQVLDMELKLLATLKFCVTCTTAHTFLQRLLFHLKLDPTVTQRAHFLNEMFLQNTRCLDFLPSEIAVAALFLAMYIHEPQSWPRFLVTLTGYRYEDVADCVSELRNMYRTVGTASLEAAISKHTSLGCPMTPIDSLTWPPESASL